MKKNINKVKGIYEGIVLVTSRYWEGSYVLKKLIEKDIKLKGIFIQKTWWNKNKSYEYSNNFLRKHSEDLTSKNRKYFTIEELSFLNDIPTYKIEDINSKKTEGLIENIGCKNLIIVGSKILKKRLINNLEGEIFNFHTGILPQYRGPYSEFWAYYEGNPENIGTTIHLIDEGVDTGPILKQEKILTNYHSDPEEGHIVNAMNGADLMARTMESYFLRNLKPIMQDERHANYFPFPSDEQISELQNKLNKKFKLYFAD